MNADVLPNVVESGERFSYWRLDGDRGMDRCHYAVPFKGISIRSTPEIVLISKRNNYKKAKMKGGLSWMTKDYRE